MMFIRYWKGICFGANVGGDTFIERGIIYRTQELDRNEKKSVCRIIKMPVYSTFCNIVVPDN